MHAQPSRSRGFTLTELLVVIAIMSIIAVPSFQSFSFQPAQKFVKSIYALQDVLALVETTAVSKNTFVWVGFGQETIDSQPALVVVAYASKSGRNDTTASNLLPIVKRSILPGMGLVSLSQPLTGQDQMGTNLLSLPSAWPLPAQQINGATVTLTQAILFTPSGESFLGSTPLSYIDIGLQPYHGATGNPNELAALQISGITSRMEMYRN